MPAAGDRLRRAARGIAKLVADLRALDQQKLKDASCAPALDARAASAVCAYREKHYTSRSARIKLTIVSCC